MPIYTYFCKDCGVKFDLLVGTSGGEELKCAKCGSKNIERQFAPFSVGGLRNDTSSSGPSCPTGVCPTGF